MGLTIPQFLAIYKALNKLPFLPNPTVICNFQNAIDSINGVSIPPPLPNDIKDLIVVHNHNPNQEEIQDEEMGNALTQVEEVVAISGHTTLCQLITKVYIDSKYCHFP